MSIFSGKSNLFLAISSLSALASIFLGSSSASAISFTIGDDLIDRSLNDSAVGSIFVVPDSFGAPTQELSSWSIFDNEASGSEITPLILEDVGSNNYNITGIGTTRTSDASGTQSFNFDLVSGSSNVGGNLYFGWKDGGNGSNNAGVIDFDDVVSDSIIWLGSNQTNFNVGQTISSGTDLGRSYSVQATAATPVPFEPSANLGILALGGIWGLTRLAKMKKAKNNIQLELK